MEESVSRSSMEIHRRVRPASRIPWIICSVKRVPLVSSSTSAPVSAARRIMVRISLWNIGSPMPPKKMVSTVFGMVASTCL